MNNENITNKKSGVWDFTPFKALLKNEKAVKMILLAGLALIALVFLSDIMTGTGGKTQNSVKEPAFEEHERRLEEKLAQALSQIDGVGEFTVIVTPSLSAKTDTPLMEIIGKIIAKIKKSAKNLFFMKTLLKNC